MFNSLHTERNHKDPYACHNSIPEGEIHRRRSDTGQDRCVIRGVVRQVKGVDGNWPGGLSFQQRSKGRSTVYSCHTRLCECCMQCQWENAASYSLRTSDDQPASTSAETGIARGSVNLCMDLGGMVVLL